MEWEIHIYGMVLGLVLLLPLGWKWDIEPKVSLPAAILTGFLSGFIVQGVEIFWKVGLVPRIAFQGISILCFSGCLILWRFFRDPERESHQIEKAILSPADGRVVYIKRAEGGELPLCEKNGRRFSLTEFVHADVLPKAGTLIGIGMNFLDVHVNRAPIRGKITTSQHINGSFLSLRKPEAVIQNERQIIVIDGENFRIGLVQIASRLVRNIIPFVQEGQEVQKGERIGMIRFGSQVDVYIPHTHAIKINVTIGQKVKAGISVLAELKE
jgi:phosphatidylserine decarboxylase